MNNQTRQENRFIYAFLIIVAIILMLATWRYFAG
jgi:Mg2+ and Co2+ transporter CorA